MGLRAPDVSERAVRRRGFGRFGGFGGDWREGGRGIFWTMDYPRSDRHFSVAIRRLTRLHSRSVEEPVNLDEGFQYNWPWLYGVEVGHWNLTDAQVALMREYLLRGGFFMCDDFHGTDEWESFHAQHAARVSGPGGGGAGGQGSDLPFHLRSGWPLPGAWRVTVVRGGGDVRARRHDSALARDLRRSRKADGGHLPQHGSGRFVGARGQSGVPGEVFGAGDTDRDQLRDLLDDALRIELMATDKHR